MNLIDLITDPPTEMFFCSAIALLGSVIGLLLTVKGIARRVGYADGFSDGVELAAINQAKAEME